MHSYRALSPSNLNTKNQNNSLSNYSDSELNKVIAAKKKSRKHLAWVSGLCQLATMASALAALYCLGSLLDDLLDSDYDHSADLIKDLEGTIASGVLSLGFFGSHKIAECKESAAQEGITEVNEEIARRNLNP